MIKNNIMIRLEKEEEYREVENLVRESCPEEKGKDYPLHWHLSTIPKSCFWMSLQQVLIRRRDERYGNI